jgi:hypothetical protein
MPKFNVTLTYDVTISRCLTVEAKNEDDAVDIAKEDAHTAEDHYEIIADRPNGWHVERA